MEKYGIFTRYEWFSISGIVWTNWYRDVFSSITGTEEELKDELKKLKNSAKEIDKKTKRKTEYKIEKFEYVPLSISDMQNIPKAERKRRKKKSEA